jgi:hypothetical protein
VGLERGPLSLVSTIEELLERKNSGSGLENREHGRRDPSRWPRDIPLSTKVGSDFVDKRRSLGRYSSLADSGHELFLCVWYVHLLKAKAIHVRQIHPLVREDVTWGLCPQGLRCNKNL